MSYFIKIKCNKCGKVKMSFSHASREVKCECGAVLLYPTGGKAYLGDGEIVEKIGE